MKNICEQVVGKMYQKEANVKLSTRCTTKMEVIWALEGLNILAHSETNNKQPTIIERKKKVVNRTKAYKYRKVVKKENLSNHNKYFLRGNVLTLIILTYHTITYNIEY